MLRAWLGVFAILALIVATWQPAPAANSLVGHWIGYVFITGARYDVDLVLDTHGHYTELTSMGSLQSQRIGDWFKLPNGNLRMTVTDWEPKTQCLPPSGCFPIRKPPGSQYRVHFTSANTALFTDVTFGRVAGTITYTRAP